MHTTMQFYFFLLPFLLVLFFFSLPVHAQKSNEIDSLLNLLKSAPNDTNKIKKYARLGWLYGETNSETDMVRKYADSIKVLSHALAYERGAALAHFYYGFNARHEGNYKEALAHLNIFIRYFTQVGDSNHVANGLYQVGVIQSIWGNYDKSLSLYLRILNIYKFKKAPYGVATALASIGNIYFKIEKYDKAIECFKSALQILDSLERGKPTQAIGVNYSNLGLAYLNKQEYDKAGKYFEEALKISRELKNDWGIANELENLGYISYRSERYQEALTYHLNALAIRERLFQKRELVLSLENVGCTYLKLKNYTAAHRYLLKSLALAQEIKSKPLIGDIYKDLADLMAEKEDFSHANEYYQLYATMKDSVLNAETTQQLYELQAKYETEKKDQQITLLAKEKEIQEKETQRQTTLKQASAGGLLAVVLLAGLLVYILRQRLKNQKVLAAKNEEIKGIEFKRQLSELEMKALRTQINPHFIFNCLNSINRMILNSESDDASRYLTKFSKLIRLILENAEETTVSLENELVMLEGYIQLEALRFKGKINYRISVDDAIDQRNTCLPSMVLQPFVENAIWHGLIHKESDDKGMIAIVIREEEDRLLCTIEDNGVGREKAKVLREKPVLKSKSMGIKMTEERLRLLSKERLKQLIRITDLKDSLDQVLGTRVDIRVPIS